jgi:cytochrome c55X
LAAGGDPCRFSKALDRSPPPWKNAYRKEDSLYAMRPVVPLLLMSLALSAHAAPDAARRTQLLYLLRQDCGSCHGMTLKGGLGPPLLPAALAQKDPAFLQQTILDGRAGTPMPPWRGLLSAEDVAWLVQQLRDGVSDAYPQ